MWSLEPVEMFPRIRMEGTRMAMLGSSIFLMMLATTPDSITTAILFLLASE